MNGIMLMIVGVSVAINILVIKIKLEKKRYSDAGMDASILVLLTIVFGGSFSGLITATVASSVVSIYLWFYPPKIQFGGKKNNKDEKNTSSAAVNDFKNSFELLVEDYKNNKV